MIKKKVFILLFVFFLATFSFYFLEAKTENELNIYSGRKSFLIEPLIDEFKKNNKNIKVNIVTGKSDEFIERLKLEGKNTKADILLTTDVARLTRAKNNNLFKKISSKILKNNIPSKYRSKDDDWFGLSVRARPIIYSKDRIKINELKSYEDLAGEKWRGRVCMRSSNNVYNQSLIAFMIINLGEKKTKKWLDNLVKNFARKPYGGDRDQIKAIASGQCDITVANTYYLANMLTSKNLKDQEAAKKVSIFWPNQDDFGVHINLSGAGVIKYAKNRKEAIELLEYLVTDKAQEWYSNINYEYSINPKIKSTGVLKKWGEFVSDDIDLSLLGKYNSEAVLLMDRVGWK